MKISISQPYGYTQIGQKDNQEDNVYPLFNEVSESQRFFILCDGVGGQEHGEVASRTVCDTIGNYLAKTYDETGTVDEADIECAIDKAYDALDAIDNVDDEKKMATTFTCVCFTDAGVLVSHMGDSRIYQVRQEIGIMYQSTDHSLVNALLMAGEITPEEANNFPRKNVITKALQPNLEKRFKVETFIIDDVKPGDYFFLCCDGVLEQLTNDRLVEILSLDLEDSRKIKLIELEGLDKTKDNFTGYLIHIKSVEGTIETKSEDDGIQVVSANVVDEKVHSKVSQHSKGLKKVNKDIVWILSAALVVISIARFAYFQSSKNSTDKSSLLGGSIANDSSRIDDKQVVNILASTMEKYETENGLAIIMDAQTGEIRNFSSIGTKGDSATIINTPIQTTLFSTFVLEACLNTEKISLEDTVDVGIGIKNYHGIEVKDHNWERGGYGELQVKQGYVYNSKIALLETINKAFADSASYYKVLSNNYKIAPQGLCYYKYSLSPIKILSLYKELANDKRQRVWKAIDYDLQKGFAEHVFRGMDNIWGKFGSIKDDTKDYSMDVCGIYPLNNPKYIIYIRMTKHELPCSGIMTAEAFKEISKIIDSKTYRRNESNKRDLP